MLFVTVITFIGLPMAQTISTFSENNFFENTIIDFAEEEESESSKNETKELENKLISKQNSFAVFQFNQRTETAFHDHLSSYSFITREVTTPPPKNLMA